MSFSSGAFSSAAFGESYAEIDVAVAITGVSATGFINGAGLDVRSIVTVNLTGTEGDTAAGIITVVADAVIVPAATPSTSTVGTPIVTGGTGVTATLTGVVGTGAAGSVIISGKAVVTPDSAAAESTVNSVTVEADASTPVLGVTSTGSVGTTTVTGKASVAITGVSAEIITDDPVVIGDEVNIEADAVVLLIGVSATTANNTVTITAGAVVIPASVVGSVAIGTPTVTTVQFDYEAIKNNYNRQRTDYVKEADSRSRTVYVEAQTSTYRTAYVRAA